MKVALNNWHLRFRVHCFFDFSQDVMTTGVNVFLELCYCSWQCNLFFSFDVFSILFSFFDFFSQIQNYQKRRRNCFFVIIYIAQIFKGALTGHKEDPMNQPASL